MCLFQPPAHNYSLKSNDSIIKSTRLSVGSMTNHHKDAASTTAAAATTSTSSKPHRESAKHQHNTHHHKIIVQHNYHDHSGEKSPLTVEDESNPTHRPSSSSASLTSSSCNNSGTAVAFPNRLHSMLTNAEADGIAHIVSFAQHGRAVQIHDAEAFRELLPRYFTLSKIASFQRQLNLYGFNRLTRGADRGCYYHELFLRGMPWLIHRMCRVKVKGTGVRARSNPEQEPDFWSMPWVGVADPQVHRQPSPYPALVPSSTTVVAISAASIVSSAARDLIVKPQEPSSTCSAGITPGSPKSTTVPMTVSSSSCVPMLHHPPRRCSNEAGPLPPPPPVVSPRSLCAVVSSVGSNSTTSSSSNSSSSSCSSNSSDGNESSGAEEDGGCDARMTFDDDDDDGDLVLSGWGMPFHYLGSLYPTPLEYTPPVTNSRTNCVSSVTTMVDDFGYHDVEDREFEQALHVLLGDGGDVYVPGEDAIY